MLNDNNIKNMYHYTNNFFDNNLNDDNLNDDNLNVDI